MARLFHEILFSELFLSLDISNVLFNNEYDQYVQCCQDIYVEFGGNFVRSLWNKTKMLNVPQTYT